MSKGRVRLTKRRKQAVDGDIPYPGNVNQPDREFKDADQYDNWEHTLNHPTPDMRHLWQDDERDAIGFGIPEAWGTSPTVASVRVAANKSVKLAYFLLGNKVAEGIIEDQASDLMLLGPEALDRTLARFAETGDLYAADETEEEADDAAEGKEAAEDDAAAETKEESDDSKEASVAELKVKLAEAEAKLAEDSDDAAAKTEEEADDAKEASESPKVAELKTKLAEVEAKLAEADAEEATTEEESDDAKEASSKEAAEIAELTAKLAKAEAKLAGDDDSDDSSDDDGDSKEAAIEIAPAVNDMDIQLSPIIADEDVNLKEDPRLAGLFDNDIPAELPEPGAGQREASEKKGIKSIGGSQVKVASAGEAKDISAIWKDAPDVGDVFN